VPKEVRYCEFACKCERERCDFKKISYNVSSDVKLRERLLFLRERLLFLRERLLFLREELVDKGMRDVKFNIKMMSKMLFRK
jgi:hypothetical protein